MRSNRVHERASHMTTRMITIGVSFKLYLDVASTLAWVDRAVEICGSSKTIRDGRVQLFVMPSAPTLPMVLDRTRGTALSVGAQDLHWIDRGAFTGAVSGADLAALGCRYVEVGHAERRCIFGEDQEVIAKKMLAATRNGLTPVLCIGEVARMTPEEAAVECIRQLESAVALANDDLADLVVAYEPHWAIGAQEPAPVEHIRTVCRQLETHIAASGSRPAGRSAVIYGGSAKAGLLRELGQDVDGLFLGRFAHDPNVVQSILAEAEQILDAA
jgi:triosephosphate isomerase